MTLYPRNTEAPNDPFPMMPEAILEALETKPLISVLESIVRHNHTAEQNPGLKVSPTIELINRWLKEAGVNDLLNYPIEARDLVLVQNSSYAGNFFIVACDEDVPMPPASMVWKVEGALNRFLNLQRKLGSDANPAFEQCIQIDRTFIEGFAAEEPCLIAANRLPEGTPDGQWQTRLRISAAIENLVAPYRIVTRFRYDHDSGEVLFHLQIPHSPSSENGPAGASDGEPLPTVQSVIRYVMHAGLHYAAAAFMATERMNRVRVIGRPLEDVARSEEDIFLDGNIAQPWFDVVFTKEAFIASNGWAAERIGNPEPAYEQAMNCDACSSMFAYYDLNPIPSCWEEGASLEDLTASVSEVITKAWAASTREDMAIEFNAAQRILAKTIAKAIAECANTTEAVRTIQKIQESVPDEFDRKDIEPSFNRLLEALVQGTVQPSDEEAVMTCFQKVDPYQKGYALAMQLQGSGELDKAIKVLIDTIARNGSEFLDTESTAYHMFDSYYSRFLYNQQRSGNLASYIPSLKKDGCKVCLASDYLYFCLVNLANMLSHSPETYTEAIRYGKQTIELAPTVAFPYRLLGRIYELAGDLDNAAMTLQQGLWVMQSNNDIAAVYFQLGSIFQQQERPNQAIACYAKAYLASSTIADDAYAALKALAEEITVEALNVADVDTALQEFGIVVAPIAGMFDMIVQAAAAAMDEEMLPAARSLLSVAHRYDIPDDAIDGVAASLYSW